MYLHVSVSCYGFVVILILYIFFFYFSLLFYSSIVLCIHGLIVFVVVFGVMCPSTSSGELCSITRLLYQ